LFTDIFYINIQYVYFYISEKRDFVFELLSTNNIDLLNEEESTIEDAVKKDIVLQGIDYLYYIFAYFVFLIYFLYN